MLTIVTFALLLVADPNYNLGLYRQTIIYNESEKVVYNYPFFHFVFIMAYLYIMAQVTDWYRLVHQINKYIVYYNRL